MNTLSNVNINGGNVCPPSSRVTSSAILQDNTEGVSTRCVPNSDSDVETSRSWYAMRTTYGREEKAYDYIIAQGGNAFYPTVVEEKLVKGKLLRQKVSRIPNIFFLYATEDEAKGFAYDNVHLPFLRFYYGHRHEGVNIVKFPLVVPDRQIQNLKIICESESPDVKIVPSIVKNFNKGEQVEVIDGKFKGIQGIVSRWHGQQRVGITIDGLCTIATAYIPNAFIKRVGD